MPIAAQPSPEMALENVLRTKDNVSAIALVFSLTDRKSFARLEGFQPYIASGDKPLLIVANKVISVHFVGAEILLSPRLTCKLSIRWKWMKCTSSQMTGLSVHFLKRNIVPSNNITFDKCPSRFWMMSQQSQKTC